MSPNKSLKGHKLMILSWEKAPTEFIDKLHKEHSDLKVVHYNVNWGDSLVGIVPDKEWEDVTILLTGSSLPTQEQAPKLEYVQVTSAGADLILKKPIFLETDITFCTANGVHGPQISEWIICTFLAFQHSIPSYLDSQREGKWKRNFGGGVEDALGQRVGVLGYGAIGRQTARVAKAMGMDVHAYTLHPRKTPESRKDEGYTPPGIGDPDGLLPSKWFSGETKEELHAFLGSGLDLLVISLPLTDKTRHLLSTAEFEVLSEKKTFVSNISRGGIISTDDLIKALDQGLVRGAALDVTDPEPLPEGHPLWSAKNIIITPHISGASTKYIERVLGILELNLNRFSEGKELINAVSRREGY